ncbi:amidohydrolase family protein [Sphingosinicella rhizophila]|uniref:Amidohydrolase family protein n=1 Tax=Sphingosinicella rhizophila TaxID=3050082 RepID=A0ABU3QAH2_9SPHN|nr:amidohydrolase family protein [Sphingosinicella sp. GR2756]MDT9600124.1 amidohydrolase family protein [Sphingosinicella sp. GR2756]
MKFMMWTASMLAAAIASGAAADPPLAKPNDRSGLYDAKTQTTNDLRRLPVAPGTNVPKTNIFITNARLFDGTGVPVRAVDLLIQGDKLVRVGEPGGEPPEGAEVIDARGRTVMPGLIDLHTHLTYVHAFGLPAPLSEESQAGAAIRGAERLRYYAESGITSVRDVASHGMAPFLLKEEVASGAIPGPRIFAAGQLIVGEGGHGTEYYALSTAPGYAEAAVREASGPDEWRAAVRANFKSGADLIKLASHFNQEEVDAAVDEAHRLGLRVTVDSETIYTRMAVDAGVDSIEHPLPRSAETVTLMAKKGIASVPTFVPYQYINSGGGYNGSTSRRFTISDERMFALGAEMKAAGVKLGVGTDVTLDGHHYLPEVYVQELRNFRRLGYSASQALVAATLTNAEILGMDDRLGTLQPGKLADLIIVDGKPDQDIEDLKKVDLVIVGGRIIVRDGRAILPPRIEEKAPFTSAK